MKIAVIALTRGGKKLAKNICRLQPDCFMDTRTVPVFTKMAELWQEVDCLICVMAAAIVVRGLVPLCQNKKNDPCVLVLDEKGRFVISLLSGHLGGGNRLAIELARKLGGQAVITTASDVTGHTALDLWAEKNNLFVENRKKLTAMSAKLVNEGWLQLFSEYENVSLPDDFHLVPTPSNADIIVAHRAYPDCRGLLLQPRTLTVGLGCNRGCKKEDFQAALDELCQDEGLARTAICSFASIDLKNDEQGLLDFALAEGIPLRFYTKEQLNAVQGVSTSAAVLAATGAKGVAEPAAVLGAETDLGPGQLIVRKKKWKDVTAAVATKQIRLLA
ncbi:MAG: cobalamin biosynthesis protein [Proteobacteria bacterium]|nr:cobalamin biosynthesis protein [Pseudomonadota bacterium]MBU1059516.1 cobalamin biosynthesis protein [Pseudomonadota bacterium]